MIFKVKPTNYLTKNQGCPLCFKTCSHNKQTNLNKIKEFCKEKDFTLLSSIYISSKSNLKFKCNKCNFSFLRTSSNLWKYNCPKCTKSITDKYYLFNELNNICEKEGYKLLDTHYIKAHAPINLICPKGHCYKTTSTTFKSGSRCRQCSYENHPGVINFGTKDNAFLSKNCSLYFVKIIQEKQSFYKVGITNNLDGRLKRLKQELKNIDIVLLFYWNKNYKQCFLIEQLILKYFKYFKYLPPYKFQGYTECLNLGIDLKIVSFLFKNADALFLNSETEGELLGYLEANQTTK